jgi:hypothetical protein
MKPFRLSHGAIAEDSAIAEVGGQIAEVKASASDEIGGNRGFYLCNLTSNL